MYILYIVFDDDLFWFGIIVGFIFFLLFGVVGWFYVFSLVGIRGGVGILGLKMGFFLFIWLVIKE